MNRSAKPADLTTVLCDVNQGVALVTLNRPEVHNAFNEAMQDDLHAVWRWVARRPRDSRRHLDRAAGEQGILHWRRPRRHPRRDRIRPVHLRGPRSQNRSQGARAYGSPLLRQSTAWRALGPSICLERVTSSWQRSTQRSSTRTCNVRHRTAAFETILLMNRMALVVLSG